MKSALVFLTLFSTLSSSFAEDLFFEKKVLLPDGNLGFVSPLYLEKKINATNETLLKICETQNLSLISFEGLVWSEEEIINFNETKFEIVMGGYPTAFLTCGKNQNEEGSFDFSYSELITHEDGTKEFMNPMISSVALNADNVAPKKTCEKMNLSFVSYTNSTVLTEGMIISGNSQGTYLNRSGYPLLSLLCK